MELSIDTASTCASLALSEAGVLIAELTWSSRSNHSAEVLPAIDRLLAESGSAKSDLRTIFVCRGPGAYSGLRAGRSLAMALAHGLDADILGLGRLEIDAYQQAAFRGPVCAVHQAGRQQIAWAVYSEQDGPWRELVAPRLSWREEFLDMAPNGTVFCGEVTGDLAVDLQARRPQAAMVRGSRSTRRAGTLAELGWRRYQAGGRETARFIDPLYLREPHITISKKQLL